MAAQPEREFDLIVVGASFAGAACALAAVQYGLRVCVLERKRDPGMKLHTTGIVVKEAAEQTWLNRMPATLVRRVEGVRLYAPNLRSLPLRVPDYYFLTTDTPNLMRWLAGELETAGVDLRLMQSFTHADEYPDHPRGRWHLPGIGRAPWLVGADGAKSRVAQRCGLGTVRDFLYGVEHEFAGAELAEPGALHCFVDRKLAPGYIGWAAQGPTGVQLGLAYRHRPDRAGVPDIDAFRRKVGERLGIPASRTADAVRAGLIPCAHRRRGARRAHSLRRPGAAPRAPGRHPDRRCRGHRFAGDRRRHPFGLAARLGGRRSHRPPSARRWPLTGTRGKTRGAALQGQACAAQGIRHRTVRLAGRPAALHSTHPTRGAAGVLPSLSA